jgi:hypothetical protein
MENHQCRKHGLVPHKFLSNGVGRRRKRICVPCLRERQWTVRRTRKLRLITLAGGQCVLCGYDRWPCSLDFHHIDPETKVERISHLCQRRDFDFVRREAEKCVLLCRNCHGEFETGCDDTVRRLAEYLVNIQTRHATLRT